MAESKKSVNIGIELPSTLQTFIHKSKYSRWLPDKNRRETWHETVERYIEFFTGHVKAHTEAELSEELQVKLYNSIINLEVMPSMRAMMTAGPALERDNVAGYNCSYVSVDRISAFDEILSVLMCGTGVGFSVERQYICKLPEVPPQLHESKTVIQSMSLEGRPS